MAVGEGGPAPGPGVRDRPAGARPAQQWLLTLLPAFPVLLLVLRLWQLSRQDMSTMLLLVQYVSPLGLLSALLIALVWAFPLAVLVLGVLGSLLRISAPDRFDPERSLVAAMVTRTPGWVYLVAVALATLTWQLRFLPMLLMLAVWLGALRSRHLYADRPGRIRVFCVVLPVVAAGAAYVVLGPAVVAAQRADETVTILLLVVPPAAGMALTGPIPARAAPAVTQAATYLMVVVAPYLMGAIFLRAPILPTAAIEVGTAAPAGSAPAPRPAASGPAVAEMVVGQVITVNDRMTVVLDQRGTVRFVPNDRVRDQVLCPQRAGIPFSAVRVHGWPVEETALNWVMPRRAPTEADPRCAGRLPVGPDSGSGSGPAVTPG